MSGIEIVGLVLAVIPLITAALTKYDETASSFKNCPKEFHSINRDLDVEVAVLMNALRSLLDDTDLDDHVILELMNDVDGKRWTDMAVQDALMNRLRYSFGVYMETIRSMNGNFLELKRLLRLGPQWEVTFVDERSFKEMYKRYSFKKQKPAYDGLIQEMRKGNLALVRLAEHVSTTNRIQPDSRKRLARLSQMPNFGRVRECATAVFHTLQDRLSVSCKGSHKISLNLKDADEAMVKPKGSVLSNECIFRLVVHHSSVASAQGTPTWQLEEAEIRSLDVTIVGNMTSNLSAMAITQQSGPSSQEKSVKWEKSSIPAAPPTALPSVPPQLVGEEIKDFCASIERFRATKCDGCFGYMIDSSKQRHGVYKPKKLLLDRKSSSAVPLSTLIATRKTAQGGDFTVADSRRLALSVSYGLLRLHNTPWLRDYWSGDDIVLFEQNKKLAADYPFASAEPSTAAVTTMTGVDQTRQASNPAIKSHIVFALAIILIELCMRKPLHEFYAPTDLNPDGSKNASTDYFTVHRLADRLEETAGKKYSDAVKRCIALSCDLAFANPTLDNEAFRRAVYEAVVAELQKDVDFAWS